MTARLTINWEDGKIRLDTGTAGGRVPKDDFFALKKAGFKFERQTETFAAPYAPYREDVVRERFAIGTEIEEDDVADNLHDRLLEKAERFEGYAGNAQKRSDEAYLKTRAIGDAIPFGQPILVGHHSEGRHRRDVARIDSGMRKTVAEGKKADYWQRRAASVMARVNFRETAPAIYRRIERLEADERQFERERERYEAEQKPNTVAFYERWLWYVRNRLNYERALYEALDDGKKIAPATRYEKGGAVKFIGQFYEVTRVNKKSVTIKGWLGIPRATYLATLDAITDYIPPAEWEAAKARQWQAKPTTESEQTA